MKLFKRTILTLTIISVISILMIKSSYANDLIDQIISLFSSNEVATSTSDTQNQTSNEVDVMDIPSMPGYFEGDVSFANSTEVIDRRTINSKTYKNQNGTYTTLIDVSPIHYKDSTNKWKDIDTNLIPSDEESVDKETTKGLAKVQFPNQAESDIVSIQRKNRRIIFKPLGFGNNNNTPANKNSKAFVKNKAKYQNIYPDMDILYTVLNDGVKEDIVLKNYSGANTFNFQVKANGLVAQKNDDGTISFIDKDTNETIFYLPKPISYDSGTEQSYGKTEYVLENLGTNNYLIKIVVDENWLTDSKTVYPVTIDPTTKYFQEGNSITNTGRDAKVYRYYPDDNYATTNLSVGENSLGYQWRSLIQINPESGAVPSNANIIDATWSVYMYAQSDGYGVYLTWSRINSTWYESTVTWNNQPSYVSSGLPQGWTSNTFGWKNWDITNLYSGWHDGSITNRGLMMWVNDQDYDKWKAFYSNEYSTQSQRPRLAVTYSLKPSATVVSPKNDIFINDTTPTFDWNYSDPDGDSQTKYQVQVATNSGFSSTVLDSGTVSSANTYWTPSTQLSSNTTYYWRVRVYDSYDWSNYSTAASFRLDTNPPTDGSIKINSDAYNTNAMDTTLTHLSATDSYSGVSKMRFSNDNTNWSSWQTFAPTASWTLSTGDGEKTVYVQYQDTAGNVSTTSSDTIILETEQLTGIREYWSYSDVGDVRINLSTGNLIYQTTNSSIPGRGPDLQLIHTYNSKSDSTDTTYGKKWGINYQMKITDFGNFVEILEGDGSEHSYTANGDNTFAPLKGDYRNLVRTGDGSYTLTEKDQTKYYFIDNILSSVVDSNGNTLFLNYDISNRIQKITDASGRELQLFYDENGRLSSTTDPANRTTLYFYDTSGNLTSIVNANGEVISYSYDLSSNMTSIQNPMSAATQITYSNEKVSQVTLPTTPSGTTNFSYTSNQTNIIDSNGSTTSYSLNSTGQTINITEPMGASPDPTTPEADFPDDESVLNKTTSAYNSYLNTLTNAFEKQINQYVPTVNGRTITNSYDQNYNLNQRIDKDDSIAKFSYDSRGNLIQEIDEIGQTTSYSYDVNNNLITTITPTGETTTNSYDTNGNLLSTTDAEGNKTTYGYNSYGNKIWEISPNGNVIGADPEQYKTEYIYDNSGNNVVQVKNHIITNPDGTTVQETTYSTYDNVGNKITDIDGFGNTIYYSYDNVGRLVYTRNPVNIDGSPTVSYTKSVNTYDLNANIIKEETIDESTSEVKSRTEYIYNSANQLLSEKVWLDVNDPLKIAETSYTYDAAGDKLTTTSPLGGITTNQFDSLGRLNKEVYSDDSFSAFKYDAGDNIIKEGTNNGTKVTLTGKLPEEVAHSDTLGNTDKNIYDVEGNEVKSADAVNNTTLFEYTSNNNLSSIIDPIGTKTSYLYDANGNEIAVKFNDQTPPLQTQTSSSYNQANTINTETDQLQSSTKIYYKKVGYVSQIEQPNDSNQLLEYSDSGTLEKIIATGSIEHSTNTSVEYDALGNETSLVVTDALGGHAVASTSAEYDSVSNLTKLTDMLGVAVSFVYDLAGNLTNITDSITGSAGNISFNYDISSKLKNIYYKNKSVTFSYDTGGNNTGITMFNGTRTSIAYDKANRITYYANRYSTTTYSAFTQSYDSKDNITAIRDSSGTASYTYDSLSRLIRAKDKTNPTVSYSYDNLGNRLTKKDSAGTTSYTYDKANQLTVFRKPNGETLTSSYDANGNLIKEQSSVGGATDYYYDNANNLVKAVKPNNDTIEFVYDGRGNRYEKKLNGTSTFYQYDNNGNILLETDANQNIKVKYIRDDGGKALAMEQNNNLYYFVYNAHGDVTRLTNDQGITTASYSYDEFGNLTASTGTIYNPLRYAAAYNSYFDSETNLYKMGARYYKPEIGRWITRDKYNGEQENPQTKNLYVYCLNNPVTMVDPTGYGGIRIFFEVAFWVQRNWTQISNAIRIGSFIKDNAGRIIVKVTKPPTIQLGSRGKWVKRLQIHSRIWRHLQYHYTRKQRNSVWYAINYIIDGKFGNKTRASVISFQKEAWPVSRCQKDEVRKEMRKQHDGIVGQLTWGKLQYWGRL